MQLYFSVLFVSFPVVDTTCGFYTFIQNRQPTFIYLFNINVTWRKGRLANNIALAADRYYHKSIEFF